MKKALAILVLVALTLVSASAAFAHPLSDVVYGNTQSGSVSYGSFGHAWYSDGAVDKGPIIPENVLSKPVVVKGVSQDNSSEGGKWYSYFDSQGKIHYYYVPNGTEPIVVKGVSQNNSSEGGSWYSYFDSKGVEYQVPIDNQLINGQWEFYKDSRGVQHYFYIDPNRLGEYRQYTDQNGVTQYYYDYTN